MATWAPAMFGDVLVSNDGIEVKTVDALAGKTVGVYFSAHWCPPCRQFTPMLAGVYDTLKREGREFEVVFASSDRTDADFAEYHKSMPWLAVPFANRDAKAKLSSKFKVQGIPTLVILDENGALVTKDGRRAVAQPEKFPWTPPTLTEALGETFVDKSGGETTLASIVAAGKNVGLYFSAHWCGPCRQFTPKLKELYAELVAAGKPFEIIFVSSDRSQAEFDEYYGEMPWLAVPHADVKRRSALSEFFEVEGIPSFAMIAPDLSVINRSARGAVGSDPDGSNFPWHPKLVTDVDEDLDEGINDTPTVLVLMEEAGDRWDDVNAALDRVAGDVRAGEKERGEERQVLFMTVTETGGGIGAQILKDAQARTTGGETADGALGHRQRGIRETSRGGGVRGDHRHARGRFHRGETRTHQPRVRCTTNTRDARDRVGARAGSNRTRTHDPRFGKRNAERVVAKAATARLEVPHRRTHFAGAHLHAPALTIRLYMMKI